MGYHTWRFGPFWNMSYLSLHASRPVQVSLTSTAVVALESRHAARFSMDWTTHPFHKIILVLRGRGRCELAQNFLSLSSGTVVVIPAGRSHFLQDGALAPLWLYVICFGKEFVAPYPALVRWLAEPRAWRSGSSKAALRLRFQRILLDQAGRDGGAEARAAGQTLDLIGSLARTTATPSPSLPRHGRAAHQVAAYLEDLSHGFTARETLEEVAERLGLSRRSFTRQFRQLAGESWLQRIRRLRVQYAATLLRHSDRAVTEIALSIGFEDLSTFYRAFARHYGSSPGRWRAAERAHSRPTRPGRRKSGQAALKARISSPKIAARPARLGE